MEHTTPLFTYYFKYKHYLHTTIKFTVELERNETAKIKLWV